MLMGTTFGKFALVDYHDLISRFDRRETMGHNDNCLLTLLNQILQRLLHLELTFGVQGGCCLVQDQNLWFAHECPCNSDPLFLTT